jgi:hypothetical protein
MLSFLRIKRGLCEFGYKDGSFPPINENRSHLSYEYERFLPNRSYLKKDVNEFDVFFDLLCFLASGKHLAEAKTLRLFSQKHFTS